MSRNQASEYAHVAAIDGATALRSFRWTVGEKRGGVQEENNRGRVWGGLRDVYGLGLSVGGRVDLCVFSRLCRLPGGARKPVIIKRGVFIVFFSVLLLLISFEGLHNMRR